MLPVPGAALALGGAPGALRAAGAALAAGAGRVLGGRPGPATAGRPRGHQAGPAGGEFDPHEATLVAADPAHPDRIEAKGAVFQGRPMYLDMAATTPLDPRVLDAMMPYLTAQYGNPHSRTHYYGWATEDAGEVARAQVARLIGADAKEIVFTSGATESNNLAVKGVANFYKARKRHVLTTQTEHKCVLDSCRHLERQGFEVTYLPLLPSGLVDVDAFANALRDDTALASVMMVNNELGVIQPVKELGAICRERKVFFHTDAAQAVGKVPIDVNEMNIDLMSISGHKLYGPKGVGALYTRRRPRVRMEPIINGGGQERGLRSGTLPTPVVVGLGAACELAGREMAYDHAHIARLERKLREEMFARLADVSINGDTPRLEQRYPGILNMSYGYVEGESLIMGLKDIAVSSGSACTSASLEPSYVLRALGVEDELAHTSIRYGMGRFTTEAEVDMALDNTVHMVNKLREMSPLWEMVQEGIDLSKIQWSQH